MTMRHGGYRCRMRRPVPRVVFWELSSDPGRYIMTLALEAHAVRKKNQGKDAATSMVHALLHQNFVNNNLL